MPEFIRTFPKGRPADRVRQRLFHCMREREAGSGASPRDFRVSDFKALAKWLGVSPGALLWDRELEPLALYEPVRERRSSPSDKKRLVQAEQAALDFQYRAREKKPDHWMWPVRSLGIDQHRLVAKQLEAGAGSREVLRADAQRKNVRVAWGVGTGPLPDIRWVLHCAGVACFETTLSPKREDAMAIAGAVGQQRFIALTPAFEKLAPAEQREQIAFQLGRLVLNDRSDLGEDAAYLCRALLLPVQAKPFLRPAIDDPKLKTQALQSFGVTPALLGERFKDWGLVKRERVIKQGKAIEGLNDQDRAKLRNSGVILKGGAVSIMQDQGDNAGRGQ